MNITDSKKVLVFVINHMKIDSQYCLQITSSYLNIRPLRRIQIRLPCSLSSLSISFPNQRVYYWASRDPLSLAFASPWWKGHTDPLWLSEGNGQPKGPGQVWSSRKILIFVDLWEATSLTQQGYFLHLRPESALFQSNQESGVMGEEPEGPGSGQAEGQRAESWSGGRCITATGRREEATLVRGREIRMWSTWTMMKTHQVPLTLVIPWIKSSPKAIIVRLPLGQRTLSRSWDTENRGSSRVRHRWKENPFLTTWPLRSLLWLRLMFIL